ncbi:MAG: methyltransferase [Deltaproteobacteria bacterium]|nr:methyltransferase [Deltaproteobacteria bacterium]
MNELDASLDSIFNGKIKLYQPKEGYRFSEDSILLADFSLGIKGLSIDLGTGCGVIPIIIAMRSKGIEKIYGVEIQERLSYLAKENVKINKLEGRIEIITQDIRKLKENFAPQVFDLVISNPPYMQVDRGIISSASEKAFARHEILLRIQDILNISRYLLKSKGVLKLVYPTMRLVDLFVLMRMRKIEPKRIRLVYYRQDTPSNIALIEGVKFGKSSLEILPPLILFNSDGSPTTEYRRIFGLDMMGDEI